MWSFERKKQQMVSRDLALPGRAEPMPVRTPHAVLGVGLNPPYPPIASRYCLVWAAFGAERVFWTARCTSDGRGLQRRFYTQSSVRRGMFRADGAYRGGIGGVQAKPAAGGRLIAVILAEPQSYDTHAAGQ